MLRRFPYGRAAGIALLLAAFWFFSREDVVAYLGRYLDAGFRGALIYALLLAAAVVIAPLATLPLIPAATTLFGPFTTGVLNVCGWAFGAVAAFLVCRYAGKPVLRALAPLEKLERFENRFSLSDEFVVLLLLRMVIPVDLLSYAAGLLTRMPLSHYALATVVGIIPFSFFFSYGGAALVERNFGALALFACAGVILFFGVTRYVSRRAQSRTREREERRRDGSPEL